MAKQIDTNKELVELGEKQKSIIERVDKVQITSIESLKETVTWRQDIKRNQKDLVTLKEHLLKHAKAEIKERNAEFKPYEDSLKNADLNLKKKQEVFQEEQEKIRRDEEKRLRKIQEKEYQKQIKKAEKKEEAPPPPPPPPKVEQEKVDGLSFRKDWDCELEDIKKVPAVFNGVPLLVADVKAARKLVKAGVREIPGFKIFQKTVSGIRQGKEDDGL